ncbi:MAG TPA: transposase [Ktedonobacterales bacterium]|nr:transposase [Ktedonobacterales bacterium]
MKQQLTAKLKLTITPDEFRVLRQTQLAYRDALNFVSAYAFAHGKTSNALRLQKETYSAIRGQFGISAQMACNIPRQVGASYKALWTKAKKHAEARRLGYTKKRFKGLDDAPRYISPTLTYSYGRDYSLKDGQRVSLLTSIDRLILPYQGYTKHVALLQAGATIGAGKLWYDRSKKRFYLLIALEVDIPDPAPEGQQQIGGVDVGQRYLATVATLGNGAQFYSGKEIRSQADHYARLQKRLQQKGTRSATRRRLIIGQRERRLKLNTNHTISKHILDTHPHSFIGLEELTGIRDRTKRKKGKKASKRRRRANRNASKWAFAELRSFLDYKAVLSGSLCVKVDADYTSQACPKCGYSSPDNRPKKGLRFLCQNCHYTLHADLVGARNIALRTLVIRQDWMTTGQLSGAPDVTDGEAKAARLSRYAELRWSPATSPSPKGDWVSDVL